MRRDPTHDSGKVRSFKPGSVFDVNQTQEVARRVAS
jgi:hypothetical protein